MSATIHRASLRNVKDLCASVDMSEKDCDIMERWYFASVSNWAGFWDGEIACVYGVMSPSLMSDEAYLWLLTNDLVRDHAFTFVRHSQIVIRELLKEYNVIHGHVLRGQINSIQWLEWLGVKLRRSETVNDLIPFNLKRSG